MNVVIVRDTLDPEMIAGEAIYTSATQNRADIFVVPSDLVEIVDKFCCLVNSPFTLYIYAFNL